MSDNQQPATNPERPMIYQIRIDGYLAKHWSEWLGGVAIRHEASGHTLLTATVVDQPALYGLLRKVRDLGLPLLSVTRILPNREDDAESEC